MNQNQVLMPKGPNLFILNEHFVCVNSISKSIVWRKCRNLTAACVCDKEQS